MVEALDFLSFSLLTSLLIWSSHAQNNPYMVFNVNRYGAVPNGKTDSSNVCDFLLLFSR